MSPPPVRPARPARQRPALAPALALGLGLALAVLPAAEARRGPADPLEGFDAQVRQELAAWNVPGAAVAIVGPAGPLLLEGFGVANRDTGTPVTPDTRFAIGSITKGFTATLLATFVDEGLLAWDRPVAEVLPDFRMADPVATETLTLRDLLTHRSGLPRHDMTWYRSGQTRDALYAGLRYLPPTAGLRDRAQYQNLMVMVAGRMAEQAGGRPWEDLVKERLLVPLGMGATGFWTQATGNSPQFASGYAERDGELVRTPFLDLTGIAPAASLASTARDLASWLRFQLDRGRVGQVQLVSPGQWNELHRAQVVAEPLPFPEFTNDAYGLGWRVTSYRGRPAYGHDGMVDGYSAVVMVVPGNGFGIAVLANRDNSLMPLALALEAADRLLGAPPAAWSARLRSWQAQQRTARRALDEAQAVDRKAGTVPAHALVDYAGEYTHPAYGALHVVFKDGGLAVNFGGITTAMTHWHFDTFRAPMGRLPAQNPTFLQFGTNLQGDVETVAVALEESASPIVFRRRPSPVMSDPDYLARFVGSYEADGTTLRVAQRGKGLLVETADGRAIELAPYRGTEYRVADGSGARAVFSPDQGPATGVLLITAHGAIQARRSAPGGGRP
jgi:CubicO group peptidase (beta-lactamase class C family)